jgi:hypothetical protein
MRAIHGLKLSEITYFLAKTDVIVSYTERKKACINARSLSNENGTGRENLNQNKLAIGLNWRMDANQQ